MSHMAQSMALAAGYVDENTAIEMLNVIADAIGACSGKGSAYDAKPCQVCRAKIKHQQQQQVGSAGGSHDKFF